ncbi:MAG: GIY-YIG nuclease family protein [Bacteroidia bacterium]
MLFKTYHVYILKCSDDSYYIGVTNNIVRRMGEYENGQSVKAYTFLRRPLKLVYKKEFRNILKAIAYEKQLKGWRRAKKEALVEGRLKDLVGLAKSHGSTSSP